MSEPLFISANRASVALAEATEEGLLFSAKRSLKLGMGGGGGGGPPALAGDEFGAEDDDDDDEDGDELTREASKVFDCFVLFQLTPVVCVCFT
jgi:hypothetical protein